MEAADLDPGAVTERTTVADKFRMTLIQIGRESAYVAWERGCLGGGGEFVSLYAGNAHIQNHGAVLDDEGQEVEPAHTDFTRFMQLAEVRGLVVPMTNFTKANAHDSELWIDALRALMDSRGV